MPRDIRKRTSISGLFGGRTIAIAIAVALSAGCFTLGYLVGQATTEKQAVTEIISVPEQGKVVVEVQPAAPIESAAAEAMNAPAPELSASSSLHPTEDAAAPEPAEVPKKKPADAKQASKPKQAVAKPAETKSSEAKPATAAAKPASSGLNYSVQVGAFSSLADADSLKRKIEASGYTSIVIFRDKDVSGKTVFKVKVGSFETREMADQMLAKLKNRDKIAGFITTTK